VTNNNVTEVDDDRWLPGEPNDASDAYSCVHLYDMGRAAALCRYPEHDTYRCVCTYNSNRSALYDLSALEDAAADYVAGLRAATAVAFVITFFASFVPLLLAFGAARVKRELRARRPQGAEQARRKSDTEMKLETQLAASRAASLSLRLRVSGSLFITGWVLGFLSFGLAGIELAGTEIHLVIGSGRAWLSLAPISIMAMKLSVLPIDEVAVRVDNAATFVLGAVALLFLLATAWTRRGDTTIVGISPIVGALVMVVLLPVSARGLDCCCSTSWRQPTRTLQRRSFSATRMVFLGLAVSTLSIPIDGLIANPNIFSDDTRPAGPSQAFGLGFSLALMAAIWTPRVRGRFRRFLGTIGTKDAAGQQAAAAISALVGGLDLTTALVQGVRLFRVIEFKDIGEVELASNKNSPALAGRAKEAELGDCDAFLSHSWNDEKHHPGEKYAKVDAWATKFEQNYQRSPRLWLDKACINPDNLDVSLACLPIFLSGCKKLLIAPGSTYSSRMWCVMEMFTWIQVGGNKDTTKVLPLGGIDFDGQIAKFDAGLAQCFLRKDKERLLAILEAAFGDLRTFNLAVKANISKGDRKSSISE